MPRNSPISAPAMKPPGLAERMHQRPSADRARASRAHRRARSSTSSESVLALAALLVEHEPGDAVVVARELPVPPRRRARSPSRRADRAPGCAARERPRPCVIGCPYTVSINMAPPCPPPMHSVAMPCLTPSRFIALTRCSTMRLPLAPTGWPSPMAPPSTLSLSRAMRAGRAVEAEHLAAERLVLPGGEAGQHLRGERLVELPQPDVAEREPVPAQDRGRRTAPGRAP